MRFILIAVMLQRGAAMRIVLTAAMLLSCSPVMAECRDVAEAKHMAETIGHTTNWIKLTQDQWQFMRGIYAMDPQTPKGLPPGDSAVMASKEDRSDGAIIFFIDGGKACSPLPVPKELVDMLIDIAVGTVHHEGDAL